MRKTAIVLSAIFFVCVSVVRAVNSSKVNNSTETFKNVKDETKSIKKSTVMVNVFKSSSLSNKEVSQLIQKVKRNKSDRKLNEKIPYFLKIAKPYPEDTDDVLKLGVAKDTESISTLEDILTTYPSVVTRKNALKSLDLIGEKYPRLVIPVLIRALDDHNITVRGYAAGLLIKLGEKEKALPVLIKIATIKNTNELVKDIMEDEYWGSEFRVIDLWLKGNKEEIIRLHPHGKDVIKDLESDPKWVERWAKQYQSYKEAIVLSAIRGLATFNTREVTDVLKKISTDGASEQIKEEAKNILANVKSK
jgi:hypothetical protein